MNNVPQESAKDLFVETIYDRYKLPLLRVIRKHIGNINACEDILHDVIIQIIGKADLLSTLPTHKMEAYIFLIAHGVSYDFLKKKYRHTEIDLTEEVIESISATYMASPEPMDTFNQIELSMMLNDISEEDRMLLIGKYYLELSVKELAAIVGGTSTAIRSKIHRAKKKVYESWRNAGLCLEDFING